MIKDRIIFFTILIVLGLAFFAMYMSSQEFWQDAVYLLIVLFNVLSGIYAVGVYGLKGSRAKGLIAFTAGVLCYLIGEVLWSYFDIILGGKPFPSIADLFYLLAYPLFFFSLVSEINRAKLWHKQFNTTHIFALLLAINALIAIVVCYFSIYLAYNPQSTLLENIVGISYGIGDLILIDMMICILILAWEYRGGQIAISWLFFLIGFIVWLIADVIFAIYNQQYENRVGILREVLDTLWMLGHVCLAYGLFHIGFLIRKTKYSLTEHMSSKLV